ncbi:hypothetical protein H5410_040483 [Solanum commersonii]|uniref:Uncharacterized protein n=1 Tax=Solanum commersonii TaxID=4109 RepID=A0A9J5XP16_SOLCO|nr:hypothetical protein H5410_040483 [Solanum commersonii]
MSSLSRIPGFRLSKRRTKIEYQECKFNDAMPIVEEGMEVKTDTQVIPKREFKMRMPKWICGHTRRDEIRNEVTQDKERVASVEDKMREARD